LKEAQKVYFLKENYKHYSKTDASSTGLGGMLYQFKKLEDIEKELQHLKNRGGEAICFFSKLLTPAQQRKCNRGRIVPNSREYQMHKTSNSF
jgi:hypothetical protein